MPGTDDLAFPVEEFQQIWVVAGFGPLVKIRFHFLAGGSFHLGEHGEEFFRLCGDALAVYFLGMFLGRESLEGNVPTKRHLVLSGIGTVVSMIALFFIVKLFPGSLSRFGFWWHPFLFSTPGCLYFTTWCLEKHEKWAPTRLLNRGLSFLGTRSFEIYLCHLLVYTVAYDIGIRSWGGWGIVFLLGFTVGCIYHFIVNKVTARLKK